MDWIKVKLTIDELNHASLVGHRRQMESIARNLKDAHGYKGVGWDSAIEGAAAEMVFSKQFNVPWPESINTFKEPDFPPDIDVKCRPVRLDHPYLDEMQLLVRPGSNQFYRYIHVVGQRGNYIVQGWAWGHEVMKPKYLGRLDHERNKAFLLPQNQLRPMSTLEL